LKHCFDLGQHQIRSAEDVAGREAEQPDSVADETVLASVVLGEVVAMNSAVNGLS
jgi:hypothetical protein